MPLRTTRPVPRIRKEKFGGGSKGSQFGGKASINLLGLTKAEKAFAGIELEEIVFQMLVQVYDRSQELVHVITGELKRSGDVVTSNTGNAAEGIVTYTANHAAPEEFGAQGREPHPYLRPAWDEIVTFGGGKAELAEGLAKLMEQMSIDT